MAIDTRYVAIVPKFDVAGFNRIKKKFESIGKGLSNIPVGYNFNSKSFTGLKTAISKEIKSKNFAVNIPVKQRFNSAALRGLKTELNTAIVQGNIIAQIPTRFDLRGAKKDLTSQLKTMFLTKPIKIPASIALTGVSTSPTTKYTKRAGGSSRSGGFGGGQSLTSATADIARYGAGFAILSEAARIITSPVGLESRLNSIVATVNNERLTQGQDPLTNNQINNLRSEIISVASELPTTILEVADAGKALAKSGIGLEDLIRGGIRETARAGVAGEESLANTADFTARMLEVFEDDFKDEASKSDAFKRISKILIGTIETTLFDLTDVQQAFKQGASGAQSAGLSGEEFGALVGAVSAMSTGSDVGTSLKTFLRFTTVAKSNEARAALDELGLNPFDAKGQIKNIREIIKLMEALNKSTDEDRLRLISDIWGQDASRAANLLSFKGLTEFLKAFDAIEKTNIDEILKTKLKGVEAQFILLRASLEKLYVNLFDPQALEGTSAGLKGISSQVNNIANFVKEIGGISGVWDHFMSSEFMIYLNGIKDVLKNIMSLFGIDIDAKINNSKLNIQNKKYMLLNEKITVNPVLQNPILRNQIKQNLQITDEKLMLMPENKTAFSVFSEGRAAYDWFSNLLSSGAANSNGNIGPTPGISGNTIYVTPPENGTPEDYGRAVSGALSLRTGGSKLDDIVMPLGSVLTPY